jgi:hypothetical protein
MLDLPFRPEEVQIFQTPYLVLKLMREKSFSLDDLRKNIREGIAFARPKRDQPILYALDHPDLNPFQRRSERIVAVYRITLEKIRAEVAAILKAEGFTVFQLHETIEAVKHTQDIGDFKHVGWAHLAGHPALYIKVRERYGYIVPRPQPINSPFVVPETTHATGRNFITIAPFDLNRQSVLEQYHRLSRRELAALVLDTMQGNVHMHEQGWAHNDIKIDHIEYTETNGRRVGLLTDTEAAAPLDSSHQTTATAEYYDQAYYGGHHHSDQPRDVFAWGVTLVDCFARYPKIDWFKRSELATVDQKKIFERVDSNFGTSHPQLVQLIKRMVQQNRQFRPALPEVMIELKGLKF